MTTQQYQQASEHFLAQAKQELAVGDLPQASEKGWGATAQILSRPSPNNGAGSTTATDTTSSPSAGSGLRPETETYAACSTQRVPCTRTSTKTR